MIQQVKRLLRPWKQSARTAWAQVRWGFRYHRLQSCLDPTVHLQAVADWLVRAQDAGSDRGVSYGAELGQDFQASYPETTGYIIPTFLDLARWCGNASYRERAVEMGDWEIAVQMPCGAVMGGRVNPNPTPAVFNTGQVLLGWSMLVRETGEPRFLEAARRAADWLLSVQDADGNWTKGNSAFANAQATLYNVKAAWGLCEAGKAGLGEQAVAAAVKNAEYCLTKQAANRLVRRLLPRRSRTRRSCTRDRLHHAGVDRNRPAGQPARHFLPRPPKPSARSLTPPDGR